MVQLPEITPEDSESRKAGYKTIAELEKNESDVPGKKIVEELKAKQAKEGTLSSLKRKRNLISALKYSNWIALILIHGIALHQI